jgi:tetratricopeptide (TPR) repeat protein
VEAGSPGVRGSFRAAAGWVLGACAVALFLHRPGFSGPFISDDVLYLEHNRAFALPLARALRTVTLESYYVLGNWSPVHQLFLLAEWRAFGADPFPYRIVNALLHAATSLAMAAAGRRVGLSRPAAFAAGALFLVHPAAAEPVGWINQSKTLLSVGFSVVALERWLAWLAAPSRGRLVATSIAGAIALLAKPAAIPLPALLLLAAWTHGAPGTVRRVWTALLPLATIGAIAFALGLVAQATQGGVAPWFGGGPLGTVRILPWLLWRYVRIVFAPFDLVHGVHPAPVSDWLDDRFVWPAAALAATAFLAVRAALARRERWLGVAWFLGMLLPVLQVVPMINLFADRYLYAALPGALWVIADVVDRAARRRGPGAQHAVFGLALLVAILFAGYAHGRARKWADPEQLYREASIAYPDGRAGWTGLGAELQKRGELGAAADCYLHSIAVFRDDAQVRHLLGRVRLAQQRKGEALYDLDLSLRLAPNHHDAAWTRKTIEVLRAQSVTAVPDEPPAPAPPTEAPTKGSP